MINILSVTQLEKHCERSDTPGFCHEYCNEELGTLCKEAFGYHSVNCEILFHKIVAHNRKEKLEKLLA